MNVQHPIEFTDMLRGSKSSPLYNYLRVDCKYGEYNGENFMVLERLFQIFGCKLTNIETDLSLVKSIDQHIFGKEKISVDI